MYVFYDTETTGLDEDFAQILQIAFVFTDENFNVLSAKKLECRRAPWVVPMPGALLTTGFIPDDLKNNKLSHYEMMREVDGWLRSQHWPLVFAGYNNFGYDDKTLANNLYQNLLDPALLRAENGDGGTNSSIDIMALVRMTAAYMQGALKLEVLNNYGMPSLSLKNVAQQNGILLSDEDAHDAMNDVRATIGVAKLIKAAAPDLFTHFMKIKGIDGARAFLESESVFVASRTRANKQEHHACTFVAASREDEGYGVVFDLSYDLAPYKKMTAQQLAALIRKSTWRDNAPETPFRILRLREQPLAAPLDLAAHRLDTDFDEAAARARAQEIKSDAAFMAKLAEAATIAGTKKPSQAPAKTVPDKMIDLSVDPAVAQQISAWIQSFHHAANWDEKAQVLRDYHRDIQAPQADEDALRRHLRLAGRIVFEHAPQALSHEQQVAMKRHIAQRLLNPDRAAPYPTIVKAREELAQIEAEKAAGKKWQSASDSDIRAIKLFYTALEKEYAPFIAQPPASQQDNRQDTRRPPQAKP